MIKILEENDMTVLMDDMYSDYRHMVDSSIKRNLVVAIKNN
jgi:hypothetical protein